MTEPKRVSEHMFSVEATPKQIELGHEMADAMHKWLEKAKDNNIHYHEACMVLMQSVAVNCAPLFLVHPEHYDRILEMCVSNFKISLEHVLNLAKQDATARDLAQKIRDPKH